jgi:glycosyltransferase involved in cell wall biosynthesis
VPVIAGNQTSLPEVVGDAGLLFDPFDTKALSDAITRLIDDSELRKTLREKGLRRAKHFSWRTTAQLTLGAYQRVANESSAQSI